MVMKNSKKLDELCRWEHIDTVNEKLDAGENPAKVHAWITSNGFKISHPMVYEYAKRRKLAAMNTILGKQCRMPVDTRPLLDVVKRVPVIKPGDVAIKRLKSELDALDTVIQLGYQTLCSLPEGAVTPKLMMEAIELKNKITEGAYGYQTELGLYCLKETEERKIKQIIEIIQKYIPESMRDELVTEIETFEDSFYIETEYYNNYIDVKSCK